MTVMLDTNIILDALQERAPFDVPAKAILKLGQSGEVTCMFTANAATDIFYLYSKARDMRSAKTALDFLLKTYTVAAITHEDCAAALSLHIEDFEDALVAVCAQKAGSDYIVTRDVDFLGAVSPVKVISPDDFLALKDTLTNPAE